MDKEEANMKEGDKVLCDDGKERIITGFTNDGKVWLEDCYHPNREQHLTAIGGTDDE